MRESGAQAVREGALSGARSDALNDALGDVLRDAALASEVAAGRALSFETASALALIEPSS